MHFNVAIKNTLLEVLECIYKTFRFCICLFLSRVHKSTERYGIQCARSSRAMKIEENVPIQMWHRMQEGIECAKGCIYSRNMAYSAQEAPELLRLKEMYTYKCGIKEKKDIECAK